MVGSQLEQLQAYHAASEVSRTQRTSGMSVKVVVYISFEHPPPEEPRKTSLTGV